MDLHAVGRRAHHVLVGLVVVGVIDLDSQVAVPVPRRWRQRRRGGWSWRRRRRGAVTEPVTALLGRSATLEAVVAVFSSHDVARCLVGTRTVWPEQGSGPARYGLPPVGVAFVAHGYVHRNSRCRVVCSRGHAQPLAARRDLVVAHSGAVLFLQLRPDDLFVARQAARLARDVARGRVGAPIPIERRRRRRRRRVATRRRGRQRRRRVIRRRRRRQGRWWR